MALSRRMLVALGIEPEKIDEIIEAHSDTVDGLKQERDKYKAEAEELVQVKSDLASAQQELNKFKEDAEKNGEGLYKKQYEDIKAEYDKYKLDVETKESLAKKTEAYKDLLKKIGVSEKRIDTVMKVSQLDDLELDDEGKIKDSDKLKENLKKEWSDFIVTSGQQGANTNNPPENKGGEPRQQSRAARLAAQYHRNLYGEANSSQEGK